jgi:hypothetical protein|tara:strand:+ start:1162 stop:1680 length:519 start_codon:yes stop_codon:yes gene_type:complete
MSGFDIRIKDNFLNKKIFDNIHSKINYYPYSATENKQDGKNNGTSHIWYAYRTDIEIKNYITNKCEEALNRKLKCTLCSYTMLQTSVSLVHKDYPLCDYQAIIYIKGNQNIHKGTGFYILNKDTNKFDLNTHIGFYENRAVIWESKTWHSPMNWLAEDKSKRFSIICQFKKL